MSRTTLLNQAVNTDSNYDSDQTAAHQQQHQGVTYDSSSSSPSRNNVNDRALAAAPNNNCYYNALVDLNNNTTASSSGLVDHHPNRNISPHMTQWSAGPIDSDPHSNGSARPAARPVDNVLEFNTPSAQLDATTTTTTTTSTTESSSYSYFDAVGYSDSPMEGGPPPPPPPLLALAPVAPRYANSDGDPLTPSTISGGESFFFFSYSKLHE